MARLFLKQLAGANPETTPETWVYVPYDQLNATLGPLGALRPGQVGIVVVESAEKASRRRYHQQKLALVLTNQRHFALEQAERGVRVDYRFTDGPTSEALAEAAREHGPLVMMEAAERELRRDVAELVSAGALRVVPHEGWLTTEADFDALGEAPVSYTHLTLPTTERV